MAQAGRFILAVGDVVVARGATEIRAGVGTAVESGDTIRVGPNSNAQVRFSDESIVGLRPGTVLSLDEYFYSGAADGREKTIFRLLKGGFRTVTGLIGRLQSKERYAVRTATATVGIRGTHYTLVHCDNDCEASPTASGGQTSPGGGVANGTYGGVSDGRIGVENATGERVFGANEFFFVANQNTAPQSLIGPPSFLYDRLAGQDRNKGQKGEETSETMAQSGMNAESRPSEVPAAPAPQEFVVTEQQTSTGTPVVVASVIRPDTGAVGSWINPALANFNDGGGAGGAFIQKTQLFFGSDGVLSGFDIPAGCVGPNDGCDSGVKASLNASGRVLGQATIPDTTSTIFWGRWSSGTLAESDGSFSLSTNNWAHFMYGPLTPAETIAAKTATVLYISPLSLGTVATNNFGELAVSVTLPSITMDFSARTATFSSSSLGFSGANPQSWSLNGGVAPIKIVSGQGAGFFGSTTGSCSGTGCGGTSAANARAAGLFLGPTGDHAGVAFSGTAGGGAYFNSVRVYTCAGHPNC